MHCFDSTQTHSIVAYLIRQGEPVIKNGQLYEKKYRFSAKKHQRNGFLAFSHFAARKHLAILLLCSDYAQTYRIVAYFILEAGKTKPSHKIVVISYLTLQKFQGLAGVGIRSMKF